MPPYLARCPARGAKNSVWKLANLTKFGAGFGLFFCGRKYRNSFLLAEEVRFELTDACASPVFKTGAIDHSATLPVNLLGRSTKARRAS